MFLYHKVSKWIDSALKQDVPDAVTAFCFNLYDDGTGKWSMELIGASRFDLEAPDWPCDEVTNFMTRETPFRWRDSAKWDSVLQNMMGRVAELSPNRPACRPSQKQKRRGNWICGW